MSDLSNSQKIKANKIIYCIGDSHAEFFSGWNSMGPEYPETRKGRLPFFKSFRLGPVLAYNICEFNTTTRGREKLLDILDKINPKEVEILLCFGEIDCRVHIIKQSRIQKKPIANIIRACVDRYWNAIIDLANRGFDVMVWNAIPSSLYQGKDPEFPTVGTCRERNRVTKIFNAELEMLCKKNNIKFFSIFDRLLLKNGLTNMDYYMDKIHLSQKAMALAIAELRKQITDVDFTISFGQKMALFWSTRAYVNPVKRPIKYLLKKIFGRDVLLADIGKALNELLLIKTIKKYWSRRN
jgi:hypothetical protein